MKHSMFHLSSQKLPPAKAHSSGQVSQSHFNMKNIVIALCMLFILSVSNSFGQAIKLQEILAEGKSNFPFLKSKQAEIHSAENRIKSVKTDYLPAFIVQDQYTFSSNNNVAGGILTQ
jgi:hypothetical protein